MRFLYKYVIVFLTVVLTCSSYAEYGEYGYGAKRVQARSVVQSYISGKFTQNYKQNVLEINVLNIEKINLERSESKLSALRKNFVKSKNWPIADWDRLIKNSITLSKRMYRAYCQDDQNRELAFESNFGYNVSKRGSDSSFFSPSMRVFWYDSPLSCKFKVKCF